MSSQPAYNDYVRHTLQHPSAQPLKITEPEGWNEDEKEYARNKIMDGIVPKFSNALRYVGNGMDFINTIRNTFGITARIRDIKDVKDLDNKWVRAYSGYLDMMTWKQKEDKVEIKFNSGGLEQLRKAREKDKVELERTTTISGKTIPALVPAKMNHRGRRIFLNTIFDINEFSNETKTEIKDNSGDPQTQQVGIPLNLFSQSHDLAHSVIPQTTSENDLGDGSSGMMFYDINDRTRNLQIKLNVDLNAYFQQYENVQSCIYKISLTTYQNGSSYNFKERIDLDVLDSGNGDLPSNNDLAYPQFTKPMSTSYDGVITLLAGESLALECYLHADMYVDNNAGVRVYAQDIEANLTIEEDSYVEPSITPGLMVYELFDRLVTIMTGSEGNFKSNFLGRTDLGYSEDGEGAFLMASHGMWIRQFTSSDELYKPFTTSFSDAVQSLMTAKNIGVGIEKIGSKEYIIIEKKDYFYNTNITTRLGKVVNGKFEFTQIQKVERKEAKEHYYSSILIGSEKGGVYEEVMGLEETNTQANFTTVIDANDAKEFKMLSKYRFDTYGAEILRRRSILTHPTTDFSGDKDIWFFDVKRGPNNVYELKTWQDVLVVEPVGMFSPETSYNFLFSPVQLLLEHGPWIATGLTKNPLDKIRFGSSVGKSKVSMQRIGGIEYAENGDISNNEIGKPVILPEEIKFEWQVDVDFINTFEGHTTFQGKKIPNMYGTFEFLNENKQVEKAMFMNLKPNGNGDWTVLKANRILKENI